MVETDGPSGHGGDGMNRRAFLGLLGTAAVAATIDPDRLLWEPGKKVTFDLAAGRSFSGLHVWDADGGLSDLLRCGDVVTIEGVYEVNPRTGEELTYPKLFVVTGDVAYKREPVRVTPALFRLDGQVRPANRWGVCR